MRTCLRLSNTFQDRQPSVPAARPTVCHPVFQRHGSASGFVRSEVANFSERCRIGPVSQDKLVEH